MPQDQDYAPVNVQLIFPGGSNPGDRRCFFFTPINDACLEFDEDLVLEGTTANTNAVIIPNRATVCIEDDDGEWSHPCS